MNFLRTQERYKKYDTILSCKTVNKVVVIRYSDISNWKYVNWKLTFVSELNNSGEGKLLNKTYHTVDETRDNKVAR